MSNEVEDDYGVLELNARGRFRILEDRVICDDAVFGALVDLTGVKGLSFDTGFGGDPDRGLNNVVLADASGWSFFSISEAQIEHGEIVGDLPPGRYAAFVVSAPEDPDDPEEDDRIKICVQLDSEAGVKFLRSFAETVEKELKAIEEGHVGIY